MSTSRKPRASKPAASSKPAAPARVESVDSKTTADILLDSEGKMFDPKKHRVEPDGTPSRTPAGKFISLRGRKSYSGIDGQASAVKGKLLGIPAFCAGFVQILREDEKECPNQLEAIRNLAITHMPSVGVQGARAEEIAASITLQKARGWRERLLTRIVEKVTGRKKADWDPALLAVKCEQAAEQANVPPLRGTTGVSGGRASSIDDGMLTDLFGEIEL